MLGLASFPAFVNVIVELKAASHAVDLRPWGCAPSPAIHVNQAYIQPASFLTKTKKSLQRT